MIIIKTQTNLENLLAEINSLGIDQYLMQIVVTPARQVDIIYVAIFRFQFYPDYIRFCEKTNRVPVSAKDFFHP